jgi:hypothetical protein
MTQNQGRSDVEISGSSGWAEPARVRRRRAKYRLDLVIEARWHAFRA